MEQKEAETKVAVPTAKSLLEARERHCMRKEEAAVSVGVSTAEWDEHEQSIPGMPMLNFKEKPW